MVYALGFIQHLISMKEEELLNIIQEVLRGVVIAMVAIDPHKLPDVAQLLMASAAIEEIDPKARQMLADLAAGLELLASAHVRRN